MNTSYTPADMAELLNNYGLNNEAAMAYASTFLSERGLLGEFSQFINKASGELCVKSAMHGVFGEIVDQVVWLLGRYGYRLIHTPSKNIYWENSGGECSDDFASERATWFDAFCSVVTPLQIDGDLFVKLSGPVQLEILERLLKIEAAQLALSDSEGPANLALHADIRALHEKWGGEHPLLCRTAWALAILEHKVEKPYWVWVRENLDPRAELKR